MENKTENKTENSQENEEGRAAFNDFINIDVMCAKMRSVERSMIGMSNRDCFRAFIIAVTELASQPLIEVSLMFMRGDASKREVSARVSKALAVQNLLVAMLVDFQPDFASLLPERFITEANNMQSSYIAFRIDGLENKDALLDKVSAILKSQVQSPDVSD